MTVIHIDFRDKEHYTLLRKVEDQLHSFGFDSPHAAIPEDAIACALDEVKKFSNAELRQAALLKIEEHFRKRRLSETAIPIHTAQTKPKV